MSKILFWIVVILVALIVARILARNAAARDPRTGRKRQAPPPAAAQPSESMVRCAHCGIHLPRSEALQLEGNTWCGQEHARLGPRR